MAINNQPTIKPRTITGIFTRFIAKTIPLAFDESMSYYECICALLNYLNETIVPDINNTNEGLSELQEFYLQLQEYVNNYFENLDVQDEINNKLDEMVEDGTLETLLNNYIQLTKVYNVFNDIILDKDSLSNGINVKTLGYYSIGDGGSALYEVTNVQDLTKYQYDLENNLYLTLINNEVYPEMFGAYGDGTHNDTEAFQLAEEYFNKINLHSGKTYAIEGLNLSNCHYINGNYATLIDIENTTNFIEISTPPRENYYIEKLTILCPNSSIGIYCTANVLYLSDTIIRYAIDKNIYINRDSTYYGNAILNNIRSESSNIGLDLHASDCFVTKYTGYNNMIHIDVRGGLTHLHQIHGWNYNTQTKDWITNSILIRVTSNIVGEDIYCDTLENCLYFNTDSQYTHVNLSNVSMFINTSSYPSTQQDPLLLGNLSNYSGYCNIDGFNYDGNNWRNSNNVYGTPIPGAINTAKINVKNGIIIGGKLDEYYPLTYKKTLSSSNTSTDVDLYLTNIEYLSLSTTYKYFKKEGYKINTYWSYSLKKALPNNTEIYSMDISNGVLKNIGTAANIKAMFVSTSTVGQSYLLDARIINNVIYIYNNTGSSLNNGSVYCYIDYDKLN